MIAGPRLKETKQRTSLVALRCHITQVRNRIRVCIFSPLWSSIRGPTVRQPLTSQSHMPAQSTEQPVMPISNPLGADGELCLAWLYCHQETAWVLYHRSQACQATYFATTLSFSFSASLSPIGHSSMRETVLTYCHIGALGSEDLTVCDFPHLCRA